MRYFSASLLCFMCIGAKANVLQYITGLSYSNPAELFKVKESTLILGGTSFYADIKFTGSVLNFNTFQYDSGIGRSRQASLLPYGRIAKRINDKLVFGVDSTQPFHSNLIWGNDAITRYAATDTLMRDIDISPRLSYMIAPTLYAGVGLNFNFLRNNETNWALPASQTGYATLINRTSGFGAGYDAGLYYMMNQTNFFGVAYYSAIQQDTRGESRFVSNVNNDIQFNFHFPATTLFNYVHLFDPTWLVNLQVIATQWNINQYARIYNTAAPAPLPKNFIFNMSYKTSWAYSAALRHQVTEKAGVVILGLMDKGPERDNLRTINFPSDTQYLLGIATDYHITKATSVELLYGHVFSKTLIGNLVAVNNQQIPFTTGRVKINADVIDFRLKIEM